MPSRPRFELPPTALRRIAPTDLAQFIRLEHCQRYLQIGKLPAIMELNRVL